MRNGNPAMSRCGSLILNSVLILPMRNGNELELAIIRADMTVLILPMRNGNKLVVSLKL